MDKDAPVEEERGLLFILGDPVVHLDDGEQAMAIFAADDARHKMKANMSYQQFSQSYVNGQPSKMHRPSTGSAPDSNPLKRPLDILLVEDKEPKAFANNRNVKMKSEELLQEFGGVPSSCASSVLGDPDLFVSLPGSSLPVLLDTGPHRTPIVPQRGITVQENNSLLRVDTHNPSEFQRGSDYMYVLRLRLVPEEGDPRHVGLSAVGVTGRIYSAIIDTSDSTFWLYQQGFRQVQLNYFDHDPVLPKITVPEGPKFSLVERAKIQYSDKGWCGIRRWDFKHTTVPLEIPSWNWKTNSQDKIVLNFPRILAERANDVIVLQPYDGNLGLAVPGWRFPWRDVESGDRTTFFDVLDNDGEPYVDTPSRVTLRLLWPRPVTELQRTPERMRSFLYFGKGYPCGIQGPNGKLIAPQYGPKIYIEESHFLNSLGERQFAHWTLRLLSMTLLVPTSHPPNYSSAAAPDWTPYPITMPNMDGMDGMRTDLDSASAFTYLPVPVIRAMQRLWFNVPPTAINQAIFLKSCDAWNNCDIIFKFKGDGTSVVDFRCNGLYFLASPWKTPMGYIAPFKFMASPPLGSTSTPPSATLGLNFFWSAIVRLDGTHRGDRPVPGVARPYVQLAPQRVIQDGRVIASPSDIGVHENAPPRVQAASRKQPDLFTT